MILHRKILREHTSILNQICSPNVLIAGAATPRQNKDFFYFFNNYFAFQSCWASTTLSVWAGLCSGSYIADITAPAGWPGQKLSSLSPFLCSDSPGLGWKRAKKEFDHEFWLPVRLNKPGWPQSIFLVQEWSFRADIWRWGEKAYGHFLQVSTSLWKE